MQSLTRLFADADTNANIRGSDWAGYQAITEYLDHAAPVHGKTTGNKAINRALRSIDGSVVDIKEKGARDTIGWNRGSVVAHCRLSVAHAKSSWENISNSS